jgi:hypothetical protein
MKRNHLGTRRLSAVGQGESTRTGPPTSDGFLSGCTFIERLRNALAICESVTSHSGFPASSQSGLGSKRQLKKSPAA